MGLTYFKRYRMEYDISERLFDLPPLPEGYELVAWRPNLFDTHVTVKFYSFRHEIDANVFPCFHSREGCTHLMSEITQRDGFVPQATWLLIHHARKRNFSEACGTIQGICDSSGLGASGFGAVQNVGILPAHRGRGLGTILLHRALVGFRAAGLDRVYLEVTAQNVGAVRLYLRLGFRKVRTVYKSAEVAFA